jgi:hypothetical protein
MQPLDVDLQLLRNLLLPEMRIVPGRALMARVVTADGTGRGSLSIAGYVLEAELPKDVRAGQELRLVVRETSSERVLLSVQQQDTPPAPPETATLPGGGTIRVTARDADPSGQAPSGSHALSLRYDAPALGAIDLHFELDPVSLRVAVSVSPAALAPAQAACDDLRAALAGAAQRTSSVTVSPRREPLEIYA